MDTAPSPQIERTVFDWTKYAEFHVIPEGAAERYGLITPEEMEQGYFRPGSELTESPNSGPGALRYARRLVGASYVYGHHDAQTIQADLDLFDMALLTFFGHVWMTTYRHAFACPQPDADPTMCGCAGPAGTGVWHAIVPADTDGSTPVTVVQLRSKPARRLPNYPPVIGVDGYSPFGPRLADAYREMLATAGLTDMANWVAEVADEMRTWQQKHPDLIRDPKVPLALRQRGERTQAASTPSATETLS
jgi:hypothetical protein